MDIINIVKEYVEAECKKPESKYGYEPFPDHFVPMVAYAEKLSNELGGDKDIILISAWLHDIGSIVCGREDHHITGAEIAEKKLTELEYPKEKIVLIKNCILHHRGSREEICKTIEEKIIVEADAMSCFENISGLFNAAFTYENLTQGEAKDSVRQKLENKWHQLNFEKSKELIRPKYEAAMLLLT